MKLLAGLAPLIFSLTSLFTITADGSLPAQPYNDLHPPASLAGSNKQPALGSRVLPAAFEQSGSWFVFTRDGQAGITGRPGTFALSPRDRSVSVQIKPIDPPPGLPGQVAADGNAYVISALVEPGGRPAILRRPVTLTLRWPHLPLGIYAYRAGQWRQLCYSSQAVFTSTTMACPTRALGTFSAVTAPTVNGSSPATSSGPNPLIPLIVGAVLVIVLAAGLGYLLTRRQRSSPG